MRRFALVALSAGLLLLLSGCGQDVPVPAPRRVEGLTLELDAGRKWQVDDHTRGSAAAMTALLDDATPIDSVDDARSLAAELDEELQTLIAGCTMTGPAHDQLHGVLAALFPRLKILKEETDLTKLQATRQELGSIFDSYEYHFE